MGWRDTLDHYVELDRTYCDEMTALNEADEEMNAVTRANFQELVRVMPTLKAAPEMLAALKELVEYDDGSNEPGDFGYEILQRCKAAIAKAEGRSE